jgi:hypothetical protein
MTRLKTVSLLFLALALVAVPSARAQTPPLTDRLPSGTVLYVYWRGADSVAAGSPNALVALWRDPGFAPARRLIEQGVVDDITRNPHLAHLPPGDIETLLRRPLILGLRLTEPVASPKAGKEANARGFLVVQASGKVADDVRAALAGAGPKAADHVRLTAASFLVASGDPSTLADLARRFGRTLPPASGSLAAVPEYREARAELAGRPPIEFFMRIPAIHALRPQKTLNFDTAAFLHALHVERVHVLCGAADLNAPETLGRFSILGNTSPGSLFDLFGPNARSFATLAAAPAGTSVNAYRLDFASVFSVVVDALSVAVPPQDAQRLKMIAGLLSTSVVPSLAGEYASIRPLPAGRRHPRAPLFVSTIHPKAANQLFATTLAPFVQAAGSEGSIHYFRSVPPGSSRPNKAGEKGKAGHGARGARRKTLAPSMFIALTPHFLLASRDEALVRRRARAVTSAAPQPGLAAQPNFRAARALLPAELTGLTYLDFASVRWTHWLERTAAKMAKNKKDPHAAEHAAALRKWARAGGGAVLARHLHWLAVGAWKNAGGVHWRSVLH